jgi:arginase family enzyme
MDRRYVPAEYDVPGGLHPAALVRLAVELRRRGLLAALEIAEFEPTDDPQSTERAIAHLLYIVGAALGVAPESR